MTENIQEQITLLETTKDENRTAIMEKGVMVYASDLYSTYPTRISQISMTAGDKDNVLKSLIDHTITSIDIPQGTNEIRQYTFKNISSLTSVTIPDSVTKIGMEAFYGCTGLTGELVIPDYVTEIGGGAFNTCSSLTSVVIGSGVTSLGVNVLKNCTSLTSITCMSETPPVLEHLQQYYEQFDNTNDCPIYVPADSVDTYKSAWSNYASRIVGFDNSDALTITYSDGTVETVNCMDLTTSGVLSSADIPSQLKTSDTTGAVVNVGRCVNSVASNAFTNTYVKSITFDAVETISASAFNGCNRLQTVVLPYTTLSIGNSAFNGIYTLYEITCYATTPPTLGSNVFSFSVNYCPAIYVPAESVEAYKTAWSAYASYIYPIGSDEPIFNRVITNSTALQYKPVNIPDGVTKIGTNKFAYCTYMSEVVIPSSVTEIGYGAFSGCTGLSTLYCLSMSPPALPPNAFADAAQGVTIYVPASSVSAYRTATNWSVYANRIFAYQIPYWQQMSYVCELDENNLMTGNITVLESDTNPSSPTYETTRTNTLEDTTTCPVGNAQQTFKKIERGDVTGKCLIVCETTNIVYDYVDKVRTVEIVDGEIVNSADLMQSVVDIQYFGINGVSIQTTGGRYYGLKPNTTTGVLSKNPILNTISIYDGTATVTSEGRQLKYYSTANDIRYTNSTNGATYYNIQIYKLS